MSIEPKIVYEYGRVAVCRVPFLWLFHYFVVELYKRAPDAGASEKLQQINKRWYELDIACFDAAVYTLRGLKTIPQDRLWFVFYSSAELVAKVIDSGMDEIHVD